jgi:hypothetical protein
LVVESAGNTGSLLLKVIRFTSFHQVRAETSPDVYWKNLQRLDIGPDLA